MKGQTPKPKKKEPEKPANPNTKFMFQMIGGLIAIIIVVIFVAVRSGQL